MRALFLRIATFLAAALTFTTVPTANAADATACDALCTRSRSDLKVFTRWLKRHRVKGYVGEVGWPNGASADAAKWDAVGQRWFEDANAARLPVTMWATGEWWGNDYDLSVFEPALDGQSVNKDNTQAPVLTANQTTTEYARGINNNGGEFGAVSAAPTSSFSNANPGTYDRAYHYDSQATFAFLASRGVKIIRLPFRWERIQPTLGAPLDAAEVTRIRDAVGRAKSAGLQVVLDMHNYGAYYLFDGTQGVRRAVGSEQVPNALFADVWKRISAAFKGNDGIYAYDLMNEPVGLSAGSKATPAKTWEAASRQAVKAIRSNGDTTIVMVPGYNWSGAQQWTRQHRKPWVKDRRVKYEAHHYLDSDHSGEYEHSYDEEVAKAEAEGYGSS